jgi:hypothetical protein
MSSLSMNKVRGRALNANTQNTNNFSMWMEPLSHKDYPLTNVVNPTNNALITSNGVKNVVIAQPGLTYNNVRLDVSGSVNPTRWTTGQTVYTEFIEGNNPLLYQIDTSISAGTVAYYTYTPRSNTSRIIVEYSCLYIINGTSNSGNEDHFESRINVTVSGVTAADPIGKRQQLYRIHVGSETGDNRSSTLFPITGAYTNTALLPVTFSIVLSRVSGDDTVKFYKAYFDACMKITEIAL